MNADPTYVLVAGCWHSNGNWARSLISRLPDLLPDESPRIVLHTGDFGIWPGRGGLAYVDDVNRALRAVNGKLMFVDGNHEDFTQLDALRDGPMCTAPVAVASEIDWLPRGHRWAWHGREWLALGGAVSVDAALRTKGLSWWPGEEITDADATLALDGGHADVMVCHDAPSEVPLALGEPSPLWAAADLARADRHRQRLQVIVDRVMPATIIHGHYHLAHQTEVRMHYGDVSVTGLDKEGTLGHRNFRIIDVRNGATPRVGARVPATPVGDISTVPATPTNAKFSPTPCDPA
jgi:hypothetical protein